MTISIISEKNTTSTRQKDNLLAYGIYGTVKPWEGKGCARASEATVTCCNKVRLFKEQGSEERRHCSRSHGAFREGDATLVLSSSSESS